MKISTFLPAKTVVDHLNSCQEITISPQCEHFEEQSTVTHSIIKNSNLSGSINQEPDNLVYHTLISFTYLFRRQMKGV